LQNNENLEITALVHDLLPVSHPHHFDRESTSEFLVYLQLVAKARSLVVGSPVLGGQVEFFLSALGFGERTEISVHDLPVKIPEFTSTTTGRTNQNEKTALFIGAFQSRKGLSGVAELFSQGQVGDLVLSVVGIPKPTDALEMQLFRQVSGYANVKLLGNLPDEDLAREMSKADVIVYLSGAEGYGLPIIEGLAAGKPVVCLDTPINNFFNRKYGGLFLVPHVNGRYRNTDLHEALISSQVEPFVRPTNLPVDETSWARNVFSNVFTDSKED
jgi:glycosyltransferase involved in cell wall biosynthesis